MRNELKVFDRRAKVALFFGIINASFAATILVDVIGSSMRNCHNEGCGAGMSFLLLFPSLLNIIIFGIFSILNWIDLRRSILRTYGPIVKKIESKYKLATILLLLPMIVFAIILVVS